MSLDLYVCDNVLSREVLIVESGRAIEYLKENKADRIRIGGIFKAQIKAAHASSGYTFADIGDETVLLETHGQKFKAQTAVPCMIKKDENAEDKKKVATTDLALYGKYVIFKACDGVINFSKKLDGADPKKKSEYAVAVQTAAFPFGVVCRSNILTADVSEVVAEVYKLKSIYTDILEKFSTAPVCSCLFDGLNLYQKLAIDLDVSTIERVYANLPLNRISGGEDLFKSLTDNCEITVNERDDFFSFYGFDGQIANRFVPVVKLPHGGNIIIETTRAMTVIDVNSAGSSSEGKGAEHNAKQVNLDACSVIAHELRFRNIGGTVVIDFISMQKEDNKKAVMECLAAECAKDRFRIDVTPEMSRLGIAELSRIYR